VWVISPGWSFWAFQWPDRWPRWESACGPLSTWEAGDRPPWWARAKVKQGNLKESGVFVFFSLKWLGEEEKKNEKFK
jgi:hypothetical protein